MPKSKDAYAKEPCYAELIAIMLVGALHVIIEVFGSLAASQIYNAIVALLFLVYLVWRVRRSPNALRTWGMRMDNFWQALRAQLAFASLGVGFLVVYGFITDSLTLPRTFWVTLWLYPIWGAAQQFALQSFVARNLKGLFTNPFMLALLASLMFAIAHVPVFSYVALTALGGIFFTLIYQRYPNLWAAGIAHGILGSMAVYIVLGLDPGADIIAFLSG